MERKIKWLGEELRQVRMAVIRSDKERKGAIWRRQRRVRK